MTGLLSSLEAVRKTILAGAAILLFAGGAPCVRAQDAQANSAPSAEQKAGESLTEPKLIVAKFHADWCGSCKALGPVMTDLENKLDGEPVLFVTFDLTNQMTRRQSQMRAAALGLENVWADNKGATGTLKVVDADSRKVLTTLHQGKSLKEMTAEISSALK